jgi:hypothetical protein
MTNDGFTLEWTKTTADPWMIHYMALGGLDITNATCRHILPASGTGDHPVDTAGFQPEFLMFCPSTAMPRDRRWPPPEG